MNQPKIISGGIFSDERGDISFVNDFKINNLSRFYMISNSENQPLRAWQGHKYDHKYFYCLSGSFQISYIKIDNWTNPSKNLKIESCILSEGNSQILSVPEGYANAILALEKDSKILVFSTLEIEKSDEDYVKFPADYWEILVNQN